MANLSRFAGNLSRSAEEVAERSEAGEGAAAPTEASLLPEARLPRASRVTPTRRAAPTSPMGEVKTQIARVLPIKEARGRMVNAKR